jgi:hypothetical protein
MAPPAAVPATPPTFHFKIRLVDATGKAFATKDYQLWWGGKMVKDGQTTADGVVEADVDDNYDTGLLDVGEKDSASKFVARLTIPVEVVLPPPPPPSPFRPPKQAAPPKAAPSPGAQWTDEADPPPPFPEYPRNNEDQEGWQRYKDQKKRWDDWASRRADRMREAQQQQQAAEDMRESRAAEDELRRQYQGGAPAPARDAPAPPLSAADKEALLDRLQHYRDEAYAARVLAYDLSWRLRNLGYLPSSTMLSFPVEGLDLEKLLDAQRRYAHKNGLKLPELEDILQGQGADATKALRDAIQKEHDG